MAYSGRFEICKGCGEDYHPSALKNGYCIGCSDEEFSVDEGSYTDEDDY